MTDRDPTGPLDALCAAARAWQRRHIPDAEMLQHFVAQGVLSPADVAQGAYLLPACREHDVLHLQLTERTILQFCPRTGSVDLFDMEPDTPC